MGLLFYPRGGSAFVVRYLSPALTQAGWSVSLASGSLGAPGEETNAATFFAGLDVHALDYTAARDAFAAGGDPIAASPPMQPSYEDRAGVPDVVFASIPPERAEYLSNAWLAPLRAAGADQTDVFHLHHLTPQLDAVRQVWPHLPLVVHLHGTDLKMIEAIDERVALAAAIGETLETMATTTPVHLDAIDDLDAEQMEMLKTTRWASWRYGEFWAAHLREQARRADHAITVSELNRTAAISELGLDAHRVTAIANGVDIEHFRPRPDARAARRATFQRVLVDDPHGWSEFSPPGTLRYTAADLDRLLGPEGDATVLLYVGRFISFKRVPLLVRAFARARSRFTRPASLVIWGGHPGEWEGEHPVTVAAEVGSDDIYFTGWRGHEDLAVGLAACDALIVPSVDDAYPQVPLEAMAAGLPVLVARSGGLISMVNRDATRPTGWFVPPDDLDALAATLAQVVDDPIDRAVRGANALAYARAELSWDRLVPQFESVYDQAIEHRRATDPAARAS